AVLENISLPNVPPNRRLRQQLSRLSTTELYRRLRQLDPQRAKSIDRHNPYRLIRAIEINTSTNRPVTPLRGSPQYSTITIGLTHARPKLNRLIDRRLDQRFRRGLVAEVQRLHRRGVSWQRLNQFGLEYRFVSRYLRGQLTKPHMVSQLQYASHRYAKRQMTWFRRIPDAHWVRTPNQAATLVRSHLDRYTDGARQRN
ncbi:MAG: tRNA dimethylallyltransferase, partial [Patescibacteria group bacterium]